MAFFHLKEERCLKRFLGLGNPNDLSWGMCEFMSVSLFDSVIMSYFCLKNVFCLHTHTFIYIYNTYILGLIMVFFAKGRVGPT